MEATSSFQVLSFTAFATTAMVLALRWIGTRAAEHHPALPPPPVLPSPARSTQGMDTHVLIAILTAAASEMLGTDRVRISEISEVPGSEIPHWPRQGRFRRHKPRSGLQF